MVIRMTCALILILIALCAVLVSDRQKPFLLDDHSSGRWDFHNTDYPVCFTVRNSPLLKSPENSPYRVGKKYNDEGEV